MNRQGKARFWLSKRLLSSHLGKRRLYSASDNRFQIYPRLFPFAMLNIMQHGKKFLKINDPTCDGSLNSVLIESNGMIDPYLPFSGVADNGASLTSWNNAELFWLLDALREPDEDGHQLDDNQVYVCQIPKNTPIPDTLRLWRKGKHYYALRSNTPMTLETLQNTLDTFQGQYGRTTTMKDFLQLEYNGLSDIQLRDLLGLWWKTCGAGPNESCYLTPRRGFCQCVAFYKANGQLPSPAWEMA